jgi:hypothetical protein
VEVEVEVEVLVEVAGDLGVQILVFLQTGCW